MLKDSDGSEEIPEGVVAIVLRHDLPQLSHIAIRARQAKVLFACCDNDETFEKVGEGLR